MVMIGYIINLLNNALNGKEVNPNRNVFPKPLRIKPKVLFN